MRAAGAAGGGLFGVFGVMAALNLAYVARNCERLRPLRADDLAPAGFALESATGPGYGNLTALRGHVVLVDFWAEWCGPCKESMPTVKAFHQRYHERGFEVFSIHVVDQRDLARARAYAERMALPFPFYLDDGRAQALYQAYSIPRMVLIDRRGFIREPHADRLPARALDRRIRELLDEP